MTISVSKKEVHGQPVEIWERATQARDRPLSCFELLIKSYPVDGTECPKCSRVWSYVGPEMTDCFTGSSCSKLVSCETCSLEGSIMYDGPQDPYCTVKLSSKGML